MNPNTGFSLPNIPAAQTVVVTFDVLIVQDPENEDILNQANVTASFQVNPSEPPVTINVPSNIVNTTVQSGNFEVVKSVNTAVATVGDVLVYTIEIINAGSVPATNVFSKIQFHKEHYLLKTVYWLMVFYKKVQIQNLDSR